MGSGIDGLGVVPQIRGFKYGLLNSVPTSPTTKFRRDSYGQFSDMIEQAPVAKVLGLEWEALDDSAAGTEPSISPVRVTFVSRGGIPNINPLDTNTHNLSIYATSSVPYTDGAGVTYETTKLDRDIVTDPPPDETDVTQLEEDVSKFLDR
jgi:hypothetical protein